MKRHILCSLVILSICLASCATTQDMEKKRAKGEVTVAVYDYDYENTYEAIKYVLQNSSVWPLAWLRGMFGNVRYHYKENTILMFFYSATMRDIELAIYFEPESKSRTQVKFAKGFSASGVDQDETIKYIVDESQYVLRTGGRGYIKYTEDNADKWEQKNSRLK